MMNLAQRSAAQEKRRRKKALMRLISHRRFSHLAAHEGLELLERARPVRSQEPGQTAIGKNFSASLASSTIIRFVVGVANPLNLFSTSGAGLAIASVNGHILAKRSDVFGKATFCLSAQAVYPEPDCVARGSEQPFPLARPELVRERDRRQLRGMQDLVRIGIADAADDAWIGKSPLERAVFGCKGGAKRIEIAREDIDSSGIDGTQTLFARDDIQRCSVLCTGFGKHERTAGKIESRQTPAARELRSWDCQCNRPAIIKCSTSQRLPSTPIAIRLPIRLSSRTTRPSTCVSGGCAVRSRKGLARRTRSTGCATIRDSSALM